MEQIQVVREGAVQRIVIDRVAKKNALDIAMYEALIAAFEAARDDDDVRVVFWTGAGGCFTAGNDLADFADPNADLSAVLRFLKVLSTFEKPVVVAVDGLAIGIGTTALLHADLVYASDRARFKLPFVDLGLVPEAGSSLFLPAMMGHAKAARWLLLGELFGAAEAAEHGLVGQVTSPDALEATAWKAACVLAAKPPHALRQSKALMRRWSAEHVQDVMMTEATIFEQCLKGPEARAAFAKFFSRRG